MAFHFRDLMTRWLTHDAPLVCPSTPDCPGEPTNPFARVMLAYERLHCRQCGEAALALHWRTEGALRAGEFRRE